MVNTDKERAGKRMSGQYFIVGAILLSAAFYMGLSGAVPLTTSPAEDVSYLFTNIQRELPRTLNFGLAEGTPGETLLNFTRYINAHMRQKYINLSTLWVVVEGTGTDTAGVTIGNFMGEEVNVTLSLPTGDKLVTVPHNTTGTTTLTALTEQYTLTIQHPVRNKTVDWRWDKVNLYAFLRMQREKQLIQDELVA